MTAGVKPPTIIFFFFFVSVISHVCDILCIGKTKGLISMGKIIKKVIKIVKTDEIKANEVKADATKKDIQETPEIYTDDLPTGKD